MKFSNHPIIDIRPEVIEALRIGRPVVALESTLITHGLPWPFNLETAQAAEAAVHAEQALPATIAILEGRPTVGLTEMELEDLAHNKEALKASRRDMALAMAQKRTAGTTVAATTALAHRAGIALFATGGIGGAHRGASRLWDISSDLTELGRTPVAVVCAGAKSVLDVPRTLEILETESVPVLGYQTSEFPMFHLLSSRQPVSGRIDSPLQAALFLDSHWNLGGAGVVLAQPVSPEFAMEEEELTTALTQAESEAEQSGIAGLKLTPFLLARLNELTRGKTLCAYQALVAANARLAAQIARCLLDITAGTI